MYHICRNIYLPKLNPECSVLSCSAASIMKQLCVPFQKRHFSYDVSYQLQSKSGQMTFFCRSYVYLLCLQNYLLMYLFWQFPVQTFSCAFFSCSSHFCAIRHCTLQCNQMAIRTESLTGVNCQCQ